MRDQPTGRLVVCLCSKRRIKVQRLAGEHNHGTGSKCGEALPGAMEIEESTRHVEHGCITNFVYRCTVAGLLVGRSQDLENKRVLVAPITASYVGQSRGIAAPSVTEGS